MSYMTKLTLFLLLNIAVMIYTIVRTKKSNLHADTKTLLYMMAVLTPFIGLILFFIKNRTKRNYSTQ
jgi:hypothetical protein